MTSSSSSETRTGPYPADLLSTRDLRIRSKSRARLVDRVDHLACGCGRGRQCVGVVNRHTFSVPMARNVPEVKHGRVGSSDMPVAAGAEEVVARNPSQSRRALIEAGRHPHPTPGMRLLPKPERGQL